MQGTPTIVIQMGPGPKVATQFNTLVQNREMANLMLLTAMQDVVKFFMDKEAEKKQGPSIVVAAPGSEVVRNPLA